MRTAWIALVPVLSAVLVACGMGGQRDSWEQVEGLKLGIVSGIAVGRATNLRASASLVCSQAKDLHLLVVGKFIPGEESSKPHIHDFLVGFPTVLGERIEQRGTLFLHDGLQIVYGESLSEPDRLAMLSGVESSSGWEISGIGETRLVMKGVSTNEAVRTFAKECL